MATQWDTTDGQPPMSLFSGGTNVIPPMSMAQPQMSMVQPGAVTAPQMSTITVPTAIINHPDVQAAVSKASSDMQRANSVSKLPTGIQADDTTLQKIANLKAIQQSGVLGQRHPLINALSNAGLAFAQGLTHQPFYTSNLEQQTAQQQNLLNTQFSPWLGMAQARQIQAGIALNKFNAAQKAGQSLVDGSQVPSQLTGENRQLAINAAKQINPNYNAAQADVNYAADKMTTGQFEKRVSNLQAFHDAFLKNADLTVKLSNEVQRSDWPLINRAIMTGKLDIQGNVAASRFAQQLYGTSMEYARQQNPSLTGQNLSDAARYEAQQVVSKIMSGAQIEGLLGKEGSMRAETQNILNANNNKLNELRGKKGIGSPSGSPQAQATAASASNFTPDQIAAEMKRRGL